LVADSSDDAIRELIECLYGAMDKQDTSTFDALVSPRVVVEVGSSAPMGLEEWRVHLQEIYLGFPDGRHVIEELLVAGSHGISRCRFVGTHTGEFQGRAPTGKKISVAAIHIDRFQGDMVVGHRAQMDMHGLLTQLDSD
jgi:predicted ester cyclase